MPRAARVIPPEGFLHVICRGNNRRKIFLCKRDYRIYRNILKKLKTEELIKILHYCFMPSHVHLLYIRGHKTASFRVRMECGRSVFRFKKPRALARGASFKNNAI